MWLVFHTSFMIKMDKWDVGELSKELHYPFKERIHVDCDACVVTVDLIRLLIRNKLIICTRI